MSEEISFTQEQLDEQLTTARTQWETDVLNPIQSERDELLQYKPKELSDEEKALQTKQQELFSKEVSLTLKENGLEQFASILKVSNEEELKEVVESLKSVVNEIKVNSGYVPNDHRQNDKYSQFEKNKDTKNMIGSKLANLFK
jgi:molecular chaperone GrpE